MEKEKVKCPDCKGSGHQHRPNTVTCRNCGGTGWVYVKK